MTSDTPQLGNANLAFSPEHLGQLLPFYTLVDGGGQVQCAGPALRKLLGAAQLVGRPVFDVLSVVKPRRVDPEKALQDVLGQRLKVELKGLENSAASALFGMAFPIEQDGTPHMLIALTPGVNARPFVEDHGLKILDFGPADGSADLLPLLAMQEDMLDDSNKRSAKLAAARDAAERLANHDVLTGLPNRRALMQALKAALERGSVAVIHLDLDRFKEINDTFGHAAGDAALKHAAAVLTDVLGAQAVCARLGGDEFVAVLEGAWTEKEVEALSWKLIARISEPFSFEAEKLSVGASVGVVIADPEDMPTADSILHHADLALYEVKRAGRGSVALCTPDLLNEQLAFQSLSCEMRRALANHEFEAHLQPQFDGRTGAILGFEALVRWNHPERGLLTPGHFLDAAERAGLIQDIDTEVRRSAMDTMIRSDLAGTPLPKISLNVTSADLVDPVFHEDLVWNLMANDLSPDRIELEIVESVFFDSNSAQIAQACQALVDKGFVLSLDDFGTGHASVLSLMNLPVTTVKIDRAFSDGVAANPRKAAMAQALIGIAETLGLSVLAEGPRDGADVRKLLSLGCDQFQCFYFGRPMAPSDALSWYADRAARDACDQPSQNWTA